MSPAGVSPDRSGFPQFRSCGERAPDPLHVMAEQPGAKGVEKRLEPFRRGADDIRAKVVISIHQGSAIRRQETPPQPRAPARQRGDSVTRPARLPEKARVVVRARSMACRKRAAPPGNRPRQVKMHESLLVARRSGKGHPAIIQTVASGWTFVFDVRQRRAQHHVASWRPVLFSAVGPARAIGAEMKPIRLAGAVALAACLPAAACKPMRTEGKPCSLIRIGCGRRRLRAVFWPGRRRPWRR